ncbi:nicotinamide-nucleotide amidohydrolase family protein [Marinitoga lauensis]|uniref:nicotinamide-nucleotide amidohydrolase family protein n=1 Tax=Marinitoga lauensis TaxID=2201189 RepID=UPI001013BF54|nr:nicotinamide-nucleotide amidohydrolase family protein [Marinitoga lauensis]
MGVINIKAAILSTGDEIVEGDILNITAKKISNILYSIGFDISFHINVNDKKDNIISSLNFLSKDNDLIIITGGLGSTTDDITREAVSEFLNETLIFDKKIFDNIHIRYKKFGKIPNDLIKKQAFVFKNCLILKNDIGSAPGLYIVKNNKHYILLPGPPDEAITIFKKSLDYITSKFNLKKGNIYKIQFYNITESQLMSILEKKLKNIRYSTKLELPIGPSLIFKDSKEKIKEAIDFIHNNLSQYIIPNNPTKIILNKLLSENKMISTAESCTGGLIGKIITDIPGSSKVYKGTIVTYSDEVKNKILNVDKNILKNFGAVSAETVELMAKNAADIFETDYSISVSGIAGPEGGTPTNL